MKPKWTVWGSGGVTYFVEVEADTAEEAQAIAEDGHHPVDWQFDEPNPTPDEIINVEKVTP